MTDRDNTRRNWVFRTSAMLFATLTLASLFGCDSKPASPPAATPSVSSANALELSDEDCLAFGRALEAAVKEGDNTAFANALDWGALLDRTTASLGLPAQAEAGFRRGAMTSLESNTGFAAQIIKEAAEGSYRFLRVRQMDGQKTVLFRLVAEAGVNYHEYLLADSKGRPRASDIFIYLSGERLSNTLRRSAFALAQQESRSWLEKLTKEESAYIKHFDEVRTMMDRFREKRYGESLAIYRKMPPELQRDKNVLLIRNQAAMFAGDQELLESIEDFRRFHSDDICLDFLLIDYYVLRKEFAKAVESLDRLDLAVGGDPYLDSLRADATYRSGDKEKAFRLAENAINGASDIVDPYFAMISLTLEEKDHVRTLAGLRRVEERFGLQFDDLSETPAYAEFARSPQGAEWASTHPRPNQSSR
jgi:hypothetical protein